LIRLLPSDALPFSVSVGHLDKDRAFKLSDLKPTAHPFAPHLMFVDWEGSARFRSAGNDRLPVPAGKTRQDAGKKGPQLEAKPSAGAKQ
jgi:hypothetical protein